MQDSRRIGIRYLAAGVFAALLLCAGAAAAQDTGRCPCEEQGAGNATAWSYGPGMMGGFGYGMTGARGWQAAESVETGIMGSELHEEMEELMSRMMAGNLSTAEQSRLIAVMNQYPGASNMMFSRMSGGYGPGAGYGLADGYGGRYGMMGGYGPGYGMMGGYGPGYGMTGGYGPGYGMMGGGGFMAVVAILAFLFFMVWFVAGILLVLWLLQQLKAGKAAPAVPGPGGEKA